MRDKEEIAYIRKQPALKKTYTRTRTAVAMHRAHVHRADASVAAWTGQTEIHHGFTMMT